MKLNHEAKTLGDAFHLPEDVQNRISATVLYEIVDKQFKLENLFDDVDDAPLEMRTTSGLLESCLNRASGAAEKLYMMWEFAKIEHLKNNKNRFKDFMGLLSIATITYAMTDKNYENFCKRFSSGLSDAKREFLNSKDDDDE